MLCLDPTGQRIKRVIGRCAKPSRLVVVLIQSACSSQRSVPMAQREPRIILRPCVRIKEHPSGVRTGEHLSGARTREHLDGARTKYSQAADKRQMLREHQTLKIKKL